MECDTERVCEEQCFDCYQPAAVVLRGSPKNQMKSLSELCRADLFLKRLSPPCPAWFSTVSLWSNTVRMHKHHVFFSPSCMCEAWWVDDGWCFCGTMQFPCRSLKIFRQNTKSCSAFMDLSVGTQWSSEDRRPNAERNRVQQSQRQHEAALSILPRSKYLTGCRKWREIVHNYKHRAHGFTPVLAYCGDSGNAAW